MNQTFQFRRFALLVRLYFEENGKWYLTKLAICFVVCAAFLSVWASFRYYESFFVFFGIILIAINGSDSTTTLANYNRRDSKGMRFLMLPSSSTEKVLASLVVNILFCILNIFFIVITIILLDYFSMDISLFAKSRSGNVGKVYSLFFLVSLFVFASIYFVKHYFVKVMLSLYLVGKFNHYIDQLFCKYIFGLPDSIRYNLFTSFTIRRKRVDGEIIDPFEENRVDYIYLIDNHPNLILILFSIILLFAIWYASFLRLREVEI